MARSGVRWAVAVVLMLLAEGPQSTAAGDPKRDCCIRIKAQAQTRVAGGATKGLIPIGYLGSQWRNGQYSLPPGYANRPTPVMVVLHGAGDWGVSMVTAFQQLAVKYRFIIIAPDSKNSLVWSMVKANKPFSADWEHVQACYRYVKSLPNVKVDTKHVVYAGFSRGGYSAGAIASRFSEATHALIMHSAVTPDQIGTRVVPIRFSTGDKDPLFTIPRMRGVIKTMKRTHPRFRAHLRVYKGSHQMNLPGEFEANVRWWLFNQAPRSPVGFMG